MNTDTIPTKTLYYRVKSMDILWGAWVKQVTYFSQPESMNIEGIYDTISKKQKSDFPFTADLRVILSCQASVAEHERMYQITLEIVDLDAISRIFSLEHEVIVASSDSPNRWYEDFELANVEIKEPGYYELNVLVDHQFKQRVPLWITAPKMYILDDVNDVKTELWPEDYKHLSDKGKI